MLSIVKMSRGVSYEEKRNRMLQFFYERKSVFMLKELEAILPREKVLRLSLKIIRQFTRVL